MFLYILRKVLYTLQTVSLWLLYTLCQKFVKIIKTLYIYTTQNYKYYTTRNLYEKVICLWSVFIFFAEKWLAQWVTHIDSNRLYKYRLYKCWRWAPFNIVIARWNFWEYIHKIFNNGDILYIQMQIVMLNGSSYLQDVHFQCM